MASYNFFAVYRDFDGFNYELVCRGTLFFARVLEREQLTLFLDDFRGMGGGVKSVRMRRANISRFALFKTTNISHSIVIVTVMKISCCFFCKFYPHTS